MPSHSPLQLQRHGHFQGNRRSESEGAGQSEVRRANHVSADRYCLSAGLLKNIDCTGIITSHNLSSSHQNGSVELAVCIFLLAALDIDWDHFRSSTSGVVELRSRLQNSFAIRGLKSKFVLEAAALRVTRVWELIPVSSVLGPPPSNSKVLIVSSPSWQEPAELATYAYV